MKNNNIRQKTTRFVYIAAVNIFLFAILLLLLNIASGYYLKQGNQHDRSSLPNYSDERESAKAIFHDYQRVQHEYQPFVAWHAKPYKGPTLTLNEQGERLHALPNPAAEKTVHFFGGSTTWGEGSDDQRTIPAIFNTLNPTYKVYNHGQLAFNSRQNLDALLSFYANGEKADVVIFYDGVNDAAFLCPTEINALPAHRLVPEYRHQLYQSKTSRLTALLYDIFLANIFRVITVRKQQGTSPQSAYNCVTDRTKAKSIASMMISNWEMAHDLVEARGGRFIAILQPSAFTSKTRKEHLKLDKVLEENFVMVYSELKQLIGKKKHPWIVNLTASLDHDDYIYIDFCHVSPNGNELIAKDIDSVFRMGPK